jgi:hypothetical protein
LTLRIVHEFHLCFLNKFGLAGTVYKIIEKQAKGSAKNGHMKYKKKFTGKNNCFIEELALRDNLKALISSNNILL